jgi:hypothetical protein
MKDALRRFHADLETQAQRSIDRAAVIQYVSGLNPIFYYVGMNSIRSRSALPARLRIFLASSSKSGR